MNVTRRGVLAGAVALPAASVAGARGGQPRAFPSGFLWGTATAGHQTEGSNTGSDCWAVEQVKPTVFSEPSGDACDSFHRWPIDLDIVRSLNLNAYRFSLEWARIEPEPGLFSIAALDHYKAMIEGCRARGLKAVVTFNHFTCPRWFALMGGWTNAEAPKLFARFCDRAARHLASDMDHAITLNEPNLMRLLHWKLPPQVFASVPAVQAAAARAYGGNRWVSLFVESVADTDASQPLLMEGHRQARMAIKASRSDLPVGLSLAIEDDQAVGPNSRLAEKRALYTDAWLELARGDDFVGVQNYERARVGDKGDLPPSADAPKSTRGAEIYPASLAGAVRYAAAVAKVPVLVSEHGIGTDNDRQRASMIPAALSHLKAAIDDGVPVLGYFHWSLLDNFEWVFGYGPKFGLVAVDRTTFKRTPKPSAAAFAAIAKRNRV